jgi:BlaI family penicillinase repressor
MRKKRVESPKISDAEWVLMRVIWNREKATANEVVEALDGQQDWKPKTIHTLLRRLTDKGALGFEKVGREYVFHPLIERAQAEQAQSQSFVHRVFEGETVPFLSRFLEAEELSADEIVELKKILNRKKRQSS